ncbi:MAG: hypothetical protein E7337_04880 [Clostridiales bacterium]|nr:hypothetical protein [Clostridiales bacterium]
MKNNKKKSILLLIAIAALLLAAVGGTVAYLVTSTSPVVNTFTPASVDTEIVEDFKDNVKSSIKVINNGNIPVYVRVAVIGNWVKDGQIVETWSLPNSFVDTSKWTIDGGYYYYNGTVAAKVGTTPGSTTNLLKTPIEVEHREDGAHLEVTVIHQSIQADGLGVSNAKDAFAKADSTTN